jgi:hypothetical protein
LKIRLNDSCWSSNKARAEGLRRLGLAQLGSKGALDVQEFTRRCARIAIQVVVPQALRHAAKHNKAHETELLNAAMLCETEPTTDNALKARAAAAAASSAAYAASSAAAYAAADASSAAAAADASSAAAAYAAAAAAADAAAADAAAYAASSAASSAAAYAADADRILGNFAEAVVQALIEMKAPGTQWLYLTETPQA